MSPVCKYPSLSIVFLVAVSLFRYPIIMFGPLTHISPTLFLPGPLILPVSGSITLHCIPGINTPTEAGFVRLYGIKCDTAEASVIPVRNTYIYINTRIDYVRLLCTAVNECMYRIER